MIGIRCHPLVAHWRSKSRGTADSWSRDQKSITEQTSKYVSAKRVRTRPRRMHRNARRPASSANHLRRLATLPLTALAVRVIETPPTAIADVTRREISRVVVAANARQWRSAFELEATPTSVVVRVRVSLVPSPLVTTADIERRIPAWREAIGSAWDEQFAIRRGTQLLPLRVTASFNDRAPHHRVTVLDSTPADDQLHWSLRATPQTIAHEFGHMLGAFDEYLGGGLSPRSHLVDSASLMAARPTSFVTLPRHLWLIRRELMRLWHRTDVHIVSRRQGPLRTSP